MRKKRDRDADQDDDAYSAHSGNSRSSRGSKRSYRSGKTSFDRASWSASCETVALPKRKQKERQKRRELNNGGAKPRKWGATDVVSEGKMRGTIIEFFHDKGYGFIRRAVGATYGYNTNNNVFFHCSRVLSKSRNPQFDAKTKWDVEFKLVQKQDGRYQGIQISGPGGKKFP